MALEQFSKYERARIIGARGLQISMDAPLLIDMEEKEMNNLNFDPLKLAEAELNAGILPISINRPLPERKEEKLKRLNFDKIINSTDEKKEQIEKKEEAIVAEEGEIMEIAEAGDELDESFAEDAGAGSED